MDGSAAKRLDAGTLEEIRHKGRALVSGGPVPIVVFHSDGNLHAVDNRCPHMGFPLHRGTVEDGILTCHWHHARFDLKSGCTFDLFADDATVLPGRGPGRARVRRRLRVPSRPGRGRSAPARGGHGPEHPAGDGQGRGGAPARRGGPGTTWCGPAASTGARRRRSGWSNGMTILSAMANVSDHLEGDEPHRPPVPGDPARGVGHQRPAAAGAAAASREQGDPARLAPAVVPVTSSRCATPTAPSAPCWAAIEGPSSPADLAEMMVAAATDHFYLEGGHVHRLHQQGLRAPRPHRLGARGRGPALAHPPAERRPAQRGAEQLALPRSIS